MMRQFKIAYVKNSKQGHVEDTCIVNAETKEQALEKLKAVEPDFIGYTDLQLLPWELL